MNLYRPLPQQELQESAQLLTSFYGARAVCIFACVGKEGSSQRKSLEELYMPHN